MQKSNFAMITVRLTYPVFVRCKRTQSAVSLILMYVKKQVPVKFHICFWETGALKRNDTSSVLFPAQK